MGAGGSEAANGVVEDAWDAAGTAAALSRVVIDNVDEVADLHRVIGLFDGIWGTAGAPPISLEHMRALAHAGNYVTMARDAGSGEVIGASVAFFAAPVGTGLHSDITGVAASARDRKLGFAIKLDQRAWALERGLTAITWTFDPLIARNAHFNLSKLRAQGVAYHVDFYGEMRDGINRGQGSDRMVAAWSIAHPDVAAACRAPGSFSWAADESAPPLIADEASGPLPLDPPAGSTRAAVPIPPDIEGMRAADPDRARAWRRAVRDTLGRELGGGGRVVMFDRERGYLIERARP